jgi:hypothetical protein
LSIIRGCVALLLSPKHLAKRQKERRDIKVLYTHPVKNDKFSRAWCSLNVCRRTTPS